MLRRYNSIAQVKEYGIKLNGPTDMEHLREVFLDENMLELIIDENNVRMYELDEFDFWLETLEEQCVYVGDILYDIK